MAAQQSTQNPIDRAQSRAEEASRTLRETAAQAGSIAQAAARPPRPPGAQARARGTAAQGVPIEQAAARLATTGGDQAAASDQLRISIESIAAGIEETG